MNMTRQARNTYRNRIENELFERVLPFWERFSPDKVHGGFFNNLDRDGSVYDTTKHIWLLARQVWMFSKLYNHVRPNEAWRTLAANGMQFLRKHAIHSGGQVYFALARDGHPIYQQRKIFTECFYALALSEFGRTSGRIELIREAHRMVELIWSWAYDWSKVGRPVHTGAAPMQMLAVPMMLLNLLDEVMPEQDCDSEIRECYRRIKLHVHGDEVLEHVAPDGSRLPGPAGRLLNPGHAIEAGWFLQHLGIRLKDRDMQDLALQMVRSSHALGWDKQHGGLYYFLDAQGFSPVQLEWSMKLWWPHCEALYAHLLSYSLTGAQQDLSGFASVSRYIWNHFVDTDHAEWFGYLDREGRVTHRFKGGPYKGCFHVPRALWLCWRLLNNWPDADPKH